MFLPDLIVRSRRVVTPRGTRPAAIHIRSGKIVGIVDVDDVPEGCPVDDATDAVVLPGLVDVYADVSDAFEQKTRAAAAGGITTIIGKSVPGEAADRKSAVDFGFWAGVTRANLDELGALAQSGVFGFVCGPISEADLRVVMPAVRWLGATLLVSVGHEPDTVIRLCREFQTRTHLVRLPSTDLLAPLFHARAAGLPITAQTSPYHLYIAATDADREARELLWAALAGGVIQMITADRTPLQLSLPVTWTEARPRGYTLDQIAQWMCLAPARLARLDRKGAIDVGYDADLVVFAPDAELTAGQTPYRGRPLRGVVNHIYLRGTRICENGAAISPPCGKLLLRRV